MDVLDRLRLFPERDREGRESDRSTPELGAQRGEKSPIDLVETEGIDSEDRQPLPCHF